MALTSTLLSQNVVGAQRLNVVTFTFDSSYPTGGETVVATDLGMRARVDAIVPAGAAPYGSGAYTVQWVSPKLKAISLADGSEAGNTTDLSGLSINVLVLGE